MTGFKGSQGVWSVNEELDVVCAGKYVALISLHDGESTRRANAKLIAAAPELLEAVRQLHDYVEDTHCESHDECEPSHPMALARGAIAKALDQ